MSQPKALPQYPYLIINPFNCPSGNPVITLYCGPFETKPDDWTATDFKNYNNHSLVIKILFEEYLDAVTPSYAVISCGEWDFGRGGTNPFTTYFYGHPRNSTIDMLEERISGSRETIVKEEGAGSIKGLKKQSQKIVDGESSCLIRRQAPIIPPTSCFYLPGPITPFSNTTNAL